MDMRPSAVTRVKKTGYILPDLTLDLNNNNSASITDLCAPTPGYQSGRLHILGPREAHLQLWPLAAYDKVSLTASSRRDSISTFIINPDVERSDPQPTTQALGIHLVWTDLTYAPPVKSGILKRRVSTLPVLKWISGHARSGTMTLVMGPSMTVMSTFLKCISGQIRDHVTGEAIIRFTGGHSASECGSDVRISFVPRVDHISQHMTVKEAIMFSSRLHNPDRHPYDHKWNVQETLAGMGLVSLADIRISSLTEAQLKRMSIALALSSYPNILVLDEPTSGLDPRTSEILIRLLKSMTKRAGRPSPAIIMTAYQPSTECLMLFDNVCLLNRDGESIYSGPPQDVMGFYDGFGFDRLPSTDPAEYMMSIANGKYGWSCFKAMASKTSQLVQAQRITGSKDIPVSKIKCKSQSSSIRQVSMILARLFKAYTMRSVFTVIQLLINILMAILLVHLSSDSSLSNDGCWQTFANLSMDANRSEAHFSFEYRKQVAGMTFGSAFLFVHPIYYMCISMVASLLIFPSEIRNVIGEISNHCYSHASYFVAVTIWQVVTIVITTAPAILYVFLAAGFPFDTERRLAIYFFICFLQCLIWTSRSLLFSIIFSLPVISSMMTIGFACVTLIFSGVLSPYHWNPVVKPLSGISDIAHEFASLMTAVYGFNRCTPDNATLKFTKDRIPAMEKSAFELNIASNAAAAESEAPIFANDYLNQAWDHLYEFIESEEDVKNITKSTSSFVLDYYQIQEQDMVYNFAFLILVVLVTQIFVYLSLRLRIYSSHSYGRV